VIKFLKIVGRLMPALVLVPMARALPQQLGCDCTLSPNKPCCIGKWLGPYELEISCSVVTLCTGDCANSFDEIGHAALIPSGPHAGKVLIWTRCDIQVNRSTPYTTHIWDPLLPSMQPTVTADVLGKIGSTNGPFCSGHFWVLDSEGKPKLFTVGGTDYNLPCHCTDFPLPALIWRQGCQAPGLFPSLFLGRLLFVRRWSRGAAGLSIDGASR